MEHIPNFVATRARSRAFAHVGCAWTRKEENALRIELHAEPINDERIAKIAADHARTTRGILSRARRMHLEEVLPMKDRAKWGLYREGLISRARYLHDDSALANPDTKMDDVD